MQVNDRHAPGLLLTPTPLAVDGVDDLSNITLPAPGAGASTLRIATVQSTPAGPQFTLAGTLTSAGQLLKAMAASSELTSAMAPEQATQLQALAADPSKVDANPGTAAVLNALENPVDGVKLLSQVGKHSSVMITQGWRPALSHRTGCVQCCTLTEHGMC